MTDAKSIHSQIIIIINNNMIHISIKHRVATAKNIVETNRQICFYNSKKEHERQARAKMGSMEIVHD